LPDCDVAERKLHTNVGLLIKWHSQRMFAHRSFKPYFIEIVKVCSISYCFMGKYSEVKWTQESKEKQNLKKAFL